MQLLGKFRVCCLQLISSSASSRSRASAKVKAVGKRNISTDSSNNMRFVQFTDKECGPQQLGVQLQSGDIVSISALDPQIPNSLRKFIEGGEELLEKAQQLIADHCDKKQNTLSEKDVNLLPPISNIDKVLGVGLNYSSYCTDNNLQPPTCPIVFSRFSSNIIGPHDDIHLPTMSSEVDWEAELAIVIGKKAKCVDKNEAENCIFGYTVAQDLTARDWLRDGRNGGQFLLGKAMDNFSPLGPVLVTKDSIPDPNNLVVRSYVNGKLKQNGNTCEMIFKPKDIISYISQFVTLLPGDIILTGTPSGVGFSRCPPEFLKAGDVLVTEIEPIGRLRNNIF